MNNALKEKEKKAVEALKMFESEDEPYYLVLSVLIQYHEELRETGTADDLIVKKDKKNIIIRKKGI